jgi:ribokinase
MPTGKPIVVVGSINIDLVAKAERIPVTGETVSGLEFRTHPGGKGANQAVAIARLGYPVRMIGKVGDDSFGLELRRKLDEAGVDTKAVGTCRGTSGVAIIVVSPSGDNLIVVTAGANAELSGGDIDANVAMIREAGMVLTQLETPLKTVEYLAQVCAEEGVPLMLDPAPAAELPSSLAGSVRWFTPNETEAAFYTRNHHDKHSPEDVAQALLGLGWPGVVLKLGAKGAYLAGKDGLASRVDAYPVRALDTTAAGDAFNGAFATGLMLGMSAAESAKFAAAAAAVSVTRAGAQPSMPTFDDVEKFLAGMDGVIAAPPRGDS